MTTSRKKQTLLLGAAWALCALGICASLCIGRGRVAGGGSPHPLEAAVPPLEASPAGILNGPAARLVAQLAVVLVATRVFGTLFRKLGLPGVVGEIVAGIVLGPSVVGWLWPAGFHRVFAVQSLGTLGLLSQVGVTVFMFGVGMELEVEALKEKARAAFLISQTGIIVPFFLGTVSALFLFPGYAGAGTGFVPFALFLGVSMSITAFPVLVRILEDRGMTRTPLGVAAVSSAAMGDASAWALLGLIVAIVRAKGLAATCVDLGLLAAFVLFMVVVARPLLARIVGGRQGLGGSLLMLAFAAGSAWTTHRLGIHPLFGAFLAGTVMPRATGPQPGLAARLVAVASAVLLPLFFAYSGLRTHIGLLDNPQGWAVCGAIVAVATVGKLGSSMAAARLNGMAWGDAYAFGALMNTRGLMELIALNVGFELGVLPPPIFTMLVLMALATTFLTGPLLDLGKVLSARSRTQPRPASA